MLITFLQCLSNLLIAHRVGRRRLLAKLSCLVRDRSGGTTACVPSRVDSEGASCGMAETCAPRRVRTASTCVCAPYDRQGRSSISRRSRSRRGSVSGTAHRTRVQAVVKIRPIPGRTACRVVNAAAATTLPSLPATARVSAASLGTRVTSEGTLRPALKGAASEASFAAEPKLGTGPRPTPALALPWRGAGALAGTTRRPAAREVPSATYPEAVVGCT